MKAYVKWIDNHLAYGKEFCTNPKERAIALYKKTRRPVEIRQGNKMIAAVLVKKDKVVYSDITGAQLFVTDLKQEKSLYKDSTLSMGSIYAL